ncbi:MAG: hypothetical protein KME13_08505 [Myxacorys californica WJT36-NPBG1]|jgi:hypothetical protein|nr:hypothetical protein [Myxacorys californica WJT36-NPBG1]
MLLSISDTHFKIDLDLWERIWAFYFNADLHIPLAHIVRASTEEPSSDWREVRMPGTAIPGVIKAGTYYTSRGKEFWYVTRGSNYLTLELKDEFYQKIVLTIEQNQTWADQLNERLAI